MAACNPAVDAVFMLQAHQVVAVEIEKVGSSQVRSEIVLSQFESNLLGIVVRSIGIIDGNCKKAFGAVLGTDSGAQVGSERCYAALPRQVISHKGHACGQRQRR